MKIDAEVYFWKYEKQFLHPLIRENKMLQQQYLPEQITQNLQRNGMDGCIAATAEDAEVQTRFLAELALTHPEIRGVVGWINLFDANASDKIQEFQQYTSIKGYRVEAKRLASILPPTMEMILANQYSLDLSTGGESDLSLLKNWVAGHPEQSFILRDAGHADTKLAPSKSWETNIRELGKESKSRL